MSREFLAPPESDFALAVAFVVTVDDFDLGSFTGCEGLGAEFVLEAREEGGNHLFVHQLPTRLKYPNIKLTRAIRGTNRSLATWFSERAARGAPPGTGSIAARTSDGLLLAQWDLLGVIPVRWTGPQFSVDQPRPVTETLELAHHGFAGGGP